MPTDFSFRFSTYLTLGLACLCLGYGEWDLLPEVSLFAGVVVGTLIVSFRTGSRYEVTIPQANRLGLTIGLIAALWVGWHYVRPDSLMHTLPWPAGLLPYLGPLLMVLMPAKLIRPKHVGDWWALQAVGLVSVALAGAMVDDGAFGTLLTFYTLAGVWSLSLFFFRWTGGEVPPVTGPPPIELAGVVSPPQHLGYFSKSLVWAMAAVILSLPFFFLTPRNGTRWQMGKQVEVGYSPDENVNLNRTGELQVNRDVVAEVSVRDGVGRPFGGLRANQLWRGPAYTNYDAGRWSPTGTVPLFLLQDSRGSRQLPNLGPEQFFLDFYGTEKLIRPVVAEPIVWPSGGASPIVNLGRDGGFRPWNLKPDGSFSPLSGPSGRVGRYRQVSAPTAEPSLGPGFVLDRRPGFEMRAGEALTTLRSVRLRRLREWSVAKLREFVQIGKLPGVVLARAQDQSQFQIAEADYEQVGQAFRDYLATSGEFKYNLNLRREDKGIDPIEDFLFNTKEGHCERFASALTLMLRSVGVPAVFVLGFKGFDSPAEGQYIIRQEHAHAWVEILVPRPTPQGFEMPRPAFGEPFPVPEDLWHWMSLDPTPDGEAGTDSGSGLVAWIDSARESWVTFFRDFIIGYNSERHREAVAAVSGTGWTYRWELGGILVALMGYLLGRPAWRWWKRRQERLAGPRHTDVPWFDQYLDALAAHGFYILPGRTPREFAQAVADALHAEPGKQNLAAIPAQITEAFYLVRYAGRKLPEPRVQQLTDLVATFAAGLRQVPRNSRGAKLEGSRA